MHQQAKKKALGRRMFSISFFFGNLTKSIGVSFFFDRKKGKIASCLGPKVDENSKFILILDHLY